MAELFDSLPGWTHSSHICAVFNCILQPTGKSSDVMSGVAAGRPGVDVHVNRGDSRSNRYRDIRPPHFVTDDERRRQTTVGVAVKMADAKHCNAAVGREGAWSLLRRGWAVVCKLARDLGLRS